MKGAAGLGGYCLLAAASVESEALTEFTRRGRTDAVLARLPPTSRIVSLTARRPKRIASPEVGVQMSMRRPLTAPPVSATTYSPLQAPASTRTRVPIGKTRGSAAITPLATGLPLAVRPRRLYGRRRVNFTWHGHGSGPTLQAQCF